MTTTSAKIHAFLSAHPRATLAEIAEGTGIEAGVLGTIVGKMCRDGELRQIQGRRLPFRYEVVKDCLLTQAHSVV